MCRWLAYSGSPVNLDELIYKPQNSLVVQSKHSRLGAETTNGDGFGVGWYGSLETPGIFRSTEPAWNDRNLRELSAHAASGRVFAHIRASTGSAVQQTNCRAVAPDLFPAIEGSTDSELLFFLALTFGLVDDPPSAVTRAVGLVEETGRRHGVAHPIQMTVATTDGETTWAFRYSSEGRSRSLFHSTDVSTLRQQYPDNPVLHKLSEDARLVVSEPLGDLHGAWREVPESTCLTVRGGHEELQPFTPAVPQAVG